MATYNGEAYLREQLDSLARQTYLPDELIVTDDGSTDDTIEILKAFAGSAPFVVEIVRNAENLGFAKNFEKALTLCSGDIVFLCDQDDIWATGKIARVVAVFEANPDVMMVINDAYLVDEANNWLGHTQLGVIRRSGVGDHSFITGCCSAHRRQFLDLVLPIGDNVEHDLWLNRAAHAAGVSMVISEPLQNFRRHGQNSSNWPMSKAKQTAVDAVASHLSYADRSPKASWAYARDILAAIAERLHDRLSASSIQMAEHRWLDAIRRQRDSYNSRLQMIECSRLQRVPMIWDMLRRGQYQHFTGWKSALKDIVRP